MSIRNFNEAAFELSLEVESWVLSKMFNLLSDSTSYILKISLDPLNPIFKKEVRGQSDK
jgi:hypothetical protein